MEKDRTKKITMIVLIIAVIGLTVAFAALSQTLTINGSANVDAATWNIHFDNLSDAKISGEAKENEKPSINDNDKVRIDGINVTLNNPKDKVVYNVDLVNEGSIDAEISNIVVPTLTEEQEKYLEFKVAYSDTDKELAIGDLLNKGETKPLTITIRYKDEIDPSDLPKGKETVNLSYELTFTQSDGESTVTTTPTEDEKEMFVWESPTVVTGLTEYGIEQVKANGGHLVIPEGVTEIAGTTIDQFNETGTLDTGFSPMARVKINSDDELEDILLDPERNIIKSVSFPSTMKKIGGMSFYGCYYLSEIKFPDDLEEIASGAFGMTGISGELVIPNRVITIGDSAFAVTQISGELYIPDSVLAIGKTAFTETQLTSVSISSNTSYENSSFPYGATINVRD